MSGASVSSLLEFPKSMVLDLPKLSTALNRVSEAFFVSRTPNHKALSGAERTAKARMRMSEITRAS